MTMAIPGIITVNNGGRPAPTNWSFTSINDRNTPEEYPRPSWDVRRTNDMNEITFQSTYTPSERVAGIAKEIVDNVRKHSMYINANESLNVKGGFLTSREFIGLISDDIPQPKNRKGVRCKKCGRIIRPKASPAGALQSDDDIMGTLMQMNEPEKSSPNNQPIEVDFTYGSYLSRVHKEHPEWQPLIDSTYGRMRP
jgi:hypothetical protein